MALLEDGVPGRVELTIALGVCTRTICAAVLRPGGTKAVDAVLLLARMLVPEPMRPGWPAALHIAASRIPHARLVNLDARLEHAAAKLHVVAGAPVVAGEAQRAVVAVAAEHGEPAALTLKDVLVQSQAVAAEQDRGRARRRHLDRRAARSRAARRCAGRQRRRVRHRDRTARP